MAAMSAAAIANPMNSAAEVSAMNPSIQPFLPIADATAAVAAEMAAMTSSPDRTASTGPVPACRTFIFDDVDGHAVI